MKYFGTDGIRGKAYETLTLELAYKVGVALAIFGKKEYVIGVDTRESSVPIAKSLWKGLFCHTKDMCYAGVISTPGLMYESLNNQKVGIMITASHNPYQDNGIKIFINGKKMNEALEEELEQEIDRVLFMDTFDVELEENEEIRNRYIKFLNRMYTPSKKRILIDCAHGAVTPIVKAIFSKHEIVFADPNGMNINEACGATKPEVIAKLVHEQHYDLGFTLDGDGDRLMMVDHTGTVFDGEMILYLLAGYYSQTNQLKTGIVVLTELANIGIMDALEELNIQPILTKVGDKYVLEALEEADLMLGGEASGHVIDRNIFPFGDGVCLLIRLLHFIDQDLIDLEEFKKKVTKAPEISKNFLLKDLNKIHGKSFQKKLNKIKEHFSGKIIVRKSGTEPVVRLKMMCYDHEELQKTFLQIKNLLEESS